MLGVDYPAKTLSSMIRSVPVLVVALVCALAAAPARAQDSPSDLLVRIDRLETAIRTLTGSVEQLQYRNQQLEQQVLRLQAELQGGAPAQSAAAPRPSGSYPPPSAANAPVASGVPPRPSAAPLPPAGAAPVIAAAPPAEPAATGTKGRGDAFDPALNPNAPGAPRPLGAGTAASEPPPASTAAAPGAQHLGAPLDLSTLSAPQSAAPAPAAELPPPPPVNTSATGAMQATLPPSNTAKDAYDLAYGYVLHKDYVQAADTFRLFLRQFPSDRLAPEALYWLGESLFQQQQYRDAAESFLAVSTKYETTARAPEALLRLGQSLAAMGEKEAACASLGEVTRKYPHAAASIKQSVEREQKRGHC